jgi:hypothetical protein
MPLTAVRAEHLLELFQREARIASGFFERADELGRGRDEENFDLGPEGDAPRGSWLAGQGFGEELRETEEVWATWSSTLRLGILTPRMSSYGSPRYPSLRRRHEGQVRRSRDAPRGECAYASSGVTR